MCQSKSYGFHPAGGDKATADTVRGEPDHPQLLPHDH